MTDSGAAITPAASVIGQALTHFPQRVHASIIASTRAFKALSNVMLMGLAIYQPRAGEASARVGGRELRRRLTG